MADYAGIDEGVMKKLAGLFYAQTWNQLFQTVAQDPQLSAAVNQIKAAGVDPATFIKAIPINKSGTILPQMAEFRARYGNVMSSVPTSQEVGATLTGIQQAGPPPATTPAGDRITATGAAIGTPTSSQERLAQTGVQYAGGGTQMTFPGANPSQVVNMKEGLNAFNPDLVKRNLQELELARLPGGAAAEAHAPGQRELSNAVTQFTKENASAADKANQTLFTPEYQRRLRAEERSAERNPASTSEYILNQYRQGQIKPY